MSDRLQCIRCGEPILGRYAKLYCSIKCRGRLGGRVAAPKPTCGECGIPVTKKAKRCLRCSPLRLRLLSPEQHRSPNTRRQFLLRTRPHQCAVCTLSEWQGRPIPLEVDHINGDASDNRADNLRLICCNCHALTPTYRGRNRGRGKPRLLPPRGVTVRRRAA